MDRYFEKYDNDPVDYADNTKQAYLTAAKQYHAWVKIGNLDWLDPKSIKMWFEYLKVQGLKPNSQHLKFAGLNNFFSYCVDEEYIPYNPAALAAADDDFKLDKVIFIKKPIMMDDEVINLREATFGSIRDRAIIQTLFDAGIRISEACALDVVDVSLEPPLLKIAPGKNRNARVIPLTYEAAGLIKQYLDTRTDSYPSLFITRLGGRFTRQGLHKLFTQYLDLVGIKAKYSVHSCRWRFGTRLADNEFKLEEIAALLGHLWLQSSKHYVNMSDEIKSQLHKKYNQD